MAGRKRRVIWTDSARAGLDEVVEYLAEESPLAVERFLDLVLRTAQSLSHLGERGRIVPELDRPDLREVFVYSYRMLYEVRESKIEIVAFLHGARDFSRWMKH